MARARLSTPAWLVAAALAGACGTPGSDPVTDPVRDPHPATIESRLARHGDDARARLRPYFEAAGVAYPPAAVTLIGVKDEARLEVWADGGDGAPRFVREYPVLAASGGAGPKLREGDRQVPEGLYRIDWLNPRSRFHLSLHVDYPNAADRARAAADGRTDLGGEIMIHGNAVSIGCLAMGDPAAEELFVLAADTGRPPRVSVILAPADLRRHRPPVPAGAPAWTGALWDEIGEAMAGFTRAER